MDARFASALARKSFTLGWPDAERKQTTALVAASRAASKSPNCE